VKESIEITAHNLNFLKVNISIFDEYHGNCNRFSLFISIIDPKLTAINNAYLEFNACFRAKYQDDQMYLISNKKPFQFAQIKFC